jgi:hypothetical protein
MSYLRAHMRRTLLLLLAFAACKHHQTYREALEVLCDANGPSGAVGADPTERHQVVTHWIEKHLTNEDGAKLFLRWAKVSPVELDRIMVLAVRANGLTKCPDFDYKGAATDAGPPPQAVEQPPIDVAAINALVPPELKDKLTFAVVNMAEGKLEVAAPQGHNPEVIFDASISAEWRGVPWPEAVSRARLVYPVASNAPVRDEAIPTGRLTSTVDDAGTKIRALHWHLGSGGFAGCWAELGKGMAAARPAFEEACKTMRVLGWPPLPRVGTYASSQ